MSSDLSNLLIGPDASIRDAASCLDRSARGIVLVVEADRTLINTITDGDIRRAMLAGINLDTSITQLLERKEGSPYRNPVTALANTDHAILLRIMQERNVRQIPLLDETGRVVDLATMPELLPDEVLPLEAVIMAGGYGTRLRPLTDELPKPMLPLGDRPLLEIIVKGLRDAGIRQVNVTTHYKGEVIAEHFKNGADFGVDIRYVNEDQPLGTAGALSLLEKSEEPLLLINGDILTRVDFKAMLNFHHEYKADLTVAVRQYEFRVPYGVIETDGVAVKGISEKPVLRQFINAGIYLLDPAIRRFIPNGQRYDIPDLIDQLLKEQRRVVCFPIREYWLDIGKSDHYDQAQLDVANGRF
jgi:dTDP-glucose pyrophosphorylase